MVLVDNKWYVASVELNGLILIPFFLILFLIIIFKQFKSKTINWKKDTILLLFLIYLWVLMDLTLFPIPIFSPGTKPLTFGFGKQTFINLQLNVIGSYMPNQLIGNLLLLAPFSFFAAIYSKKFIKLANNLSLMFFISLTIECLQLIMSFFYLGNRTFDINDLLLNTLGSLIGLGCFKLLNRILNKNFGV